MVATSTTKAKSSTKAADAAKSAQKSAASKSYHTTHPSWIDMITECITTTSDGTRHGVSRPAIKKFVDSKYHLEFNPSVSSQLNRAIHQGADKGKFVLPKGPSGKVKLAPRRHNEAAKENTKPASKRSTVAKEGQATPIKAAPKTAAKKTSRAAKPAVTAPSASLKSGTGEKKYHSTAKKAKATGTSTRRTAERKATTTQSTAKKTAIGKTTASKTRRGAAPAKRTTRAAASKQRGKRASRK
ncbi:hypothetical protein M405DRAFT_484557 [Rhizopogon salebrosus TDB-379]|nr:hypothetical protein M405DRAFT_484557 [Rhizopogon salebrosus TDB-379]